MKIIQTIIIAGLLMTSLSSMAANRCTTWGCLSTISTLYTNANGAIYIGTPFDEKLANCSPASGVYFSLDPNAANAKEVYSTLLSSFMTNSVIQLRIKEGSTNCQLAYVRLNR